MSEEEEMDRQRPSEASSSERIGVLLVNTGTPADPSPQAVREYLGRFLTHPHIRPMNRVLWWILLHTRILRVRSSRSSAKYETLWKSDGFPFNRIHESIAEGLGAYYRDHDMDVVVRHAMSFGDPTIEQAIRELDEQGCTRLVVLPLYPQSAYSTEGVAADGVSQAVDSVSWDKPVDIVENYYDDPLYIRAVAASVLHAGFDPSSDDRLFLSYHSIPLADIEAGDTYELQVDATSLAIADELDLDRNRWTIGYQSRFDQARTWLSPFTRSTLLSWAESDSPARVFIVCPNFAVDSLETTYEICRVIIPEYADRRQAWARGERDFDDDDDPDASSDDVCGGDAPVAGKHARDQVEYDDDKLVYVPCLNKSKAHLKVLAHVLEPYVEGGGDQGDD